MCLHADEYKVGSDAANAALTIPATGHLLCVRVHAVDTVHSLLKHTRLYLLQQIQLAIVKDQSRKNAFDISQ